jgi:hypoxanthine phosphoribosyltransferase
MKFIYKNYILLIILVIFVYHYYIQNGLEKIFCETFFKYKDVKRPRDKCNSQFSSGLNCIGMPSGHAECSTILFGLLYFNKFISLYIFAFLVFIFSIQRVISNMHTVSQVITGIILGLFYLQIYFYFNLSLSSFAIILFIGLLLAIFTVYKIDNIVHQPLPQWVATDMIPSIRKKQETPYYLKILSIYLNAYVQEKTIITWNELEISLDMIIDKIEKTNTKFDAVVGIKTGGAIISDYVSNKLNLPNYKIKLTKSKHKCDKKPQDTINNIIQHQVFNNYGEYTICEGIDDNLKGKNVILIDEMVSSGTTMIEAVKYLRNEKEVNVIYPSCIFLSKKRYKKDVYVNYILQNSAFVWPWGYDN